MAITQLHNRLASCLKSEKGQMTVELAVVFPIALFIALVVVNVLTFVSECAAFDRVACNAVRLCATSPSYGEGIAESNAQVQQKLEEAMSAKNTEVVSQAQATGWGHTRFTLELKYYPTLFGMGLRSSIGGIALPPLVHQVEYTIDRYKPGMLF